MVFRAPVLGDHQLLEVVLVRHVTELDQNRGNIRGLEHPETCRLERMLVQLRGRVFHLAPPRRGRSDVRSSWSRAGSRSIRMSATSVGSSVERLTPAIASALFSVVREARRLGVGCRIRHGVNGGALRIGLAARGECVGMDGDEQRGSPALRATFTRSPSATKRSSVRVIATRYLPAFSSFACSACANSRTICFSISPVDATVPLSIPPWPGIDHDQRTAVARPLDRLGPLRVVGADRRLSPARGFA